MMTARSSQQSATDWQVVSQLIYACETGKTDVVRHLVAEKICDPNNIKTGKNQSTPLHVACERGQIVIVRYLIGELGCDPCIKNNNQISPLQKACEYKHYKIVCYIVEERARNPKYKEVKSDEYQIALLKVACDHGCVDVIRYLIGSCKPGHNPGIGNVDRDEITSHVYSIACDRYYLGIIEYLITKQGCDPQVTSTDYKCTALHVACAVGSIDFVKNLIEKQRCDLYSRDVNQDTPLHYACKCGHYETVRYLVYVHHQLVHQLTPKHVTDHCTLYYRNAIQATPLHYACLNGHVNIVQYISNELGCDPCMEDADQATPLHYACLNGCFETLHDEIRCEFFPGIAIANQAAPSHYVPSSGHYEIVQHLINKLNCDPCAKDAKKATPLHYACMGGAINIACFLIQDCGCNTEVKDMQGNTLLHFACMGGRTDMINFLINKRKLDSSIKNRFHETPLHIGIIFGRIDVVKYYIKKYPGITNDCFINIQDISCPTHLKGRDDKNTLTRVTMLHIACSSGHIDIVKYLIEEKGMDPAIGCELQNYTPLRCACTSGQLSVTKYLLKFQDAYKTVALIKEAELASFSGQVSVVKYLIQFIDPSVEFEDDYGNNLFHYAVCGYNTQKAIKVIEALISVTNKFDKNKINQFGETALYVACKKEKSGIVYYLLSKGCDPSTSDLDGITPLWITCNPDIIKAFMPYVPRDVYERILSDDIEESVGLDLLKYMMQKVKWDPNEKSYNGDTALHLACEADKLTIVEYLLSNNCDPYMKNEYGQIPLELTSTPQIIRSFYNYGVHQIDILANLVLEESEMLMLIQEIPIYSRDGQHLQIVNNDGNSALHLACMANRSSIVHYLFHKTGIEWDVNAKNIEGKTPIQLLITKPEIIRELIQHGSRPEDLYSYCRKVLRTSSLLQTATKVFVIGDLDVGKSTLISTLKKEEAAFWTRLINYFKLLFTHRQPSLPKHNIETGSGVVIHDFNSKYCGRMTLYDFVGDLIFHESQSDLLKETRFSPRVFIIIINLSDSDNKINEDIHYWLSGFLHPTSSTELKLPMHTIIIGSKGDLCKSDVNRKVNLVQNYLKNSECMLPKESTIEVRDFISLDCRESRSPGMTKLRHCLENSCNTVRSPKTIKFNAHCFQVYLLDSFRESVAITIHEIQSQIERNKENVTEDEPLFFLPGDSKQLLKLCNELHEKSQILFLKNLKNIEDSWVVIDKTALISHTVELFNSEAFRQLPSNTGVLPLSTISSLQLFRKYDPKMYIQFLIHLEFCKEISDRKLYYLITGCQAKSINLSDERCFFFPTLVKSNVPVEIWNNNASFTHHFGWILECSDSHQFFSLDFLQVLILRVLFTFSEEHDYPSIQVQRKCSVWKNGVFWGSTYGAESLVKVSPTNKAIVFFMRWQEANRAHCLKHRSQIIGTIRSCAKEFCSKLKTKESFFDPKENPIDKIPSVLYEQNSVMKVSVSINRKLLDQPYVQARSGKTVKLEELIDFEPYAKLPASVIQELYNCHNPRYITILSENFLIRFTEQVGKSTILKEIITLILHESGILQSESDILLSMDTLTIRLREWRQVCNVTYQQLHKSLDQFSVFAGVNILDVVPGLAPENNKFLTPPSSPKLKSNTMASSVLEDSENHGKTWDDNGYFPQLGDMPKLAQLQLLINREGTGIRIIETLAPNWKIIAALFGFKGPKIKTIQLNSFYQQEEACFNMFTKWLNKEHGLKPPRWYYLIQCLEESGKFDVLARDLKKIIMLQEDNKPTMHQLHVLKAEDRSEVRIIDTVADDDWGKMAVSLGFDQSIRTRIFVQALYNPEDACKCMFERWLKGGKGLKQATWRDLIKCLKDSSYKDLARKIDKFVLR